MAIAIKGQEAPISYWLTLISGGVDPVVDGLSTADGSTSKIRQYIMTCEVLFLCDDFLKTVANDQFTV
jgi:hypothetical protein